MDSVHPYPVRGRPPYPVSLFPKPIGPVHIHCRLPLLGLKVVILSLLESAFSLQLLGRERQVRMGRGQMEPLWGRDGQQQEKGSPCPDAGVCR